MHGKGKKGIGNCISEGSIFQGPLYDGCLFGEYSQQGGQDTVLRGGGLRLEELIVLLEGRSRGMSLSS